MGRLNLSQEKHLYYELIEGNQNYPYLVFLHEGLGCTAMWEDFPARLCMVTGCPGLVYDRLGYGKSSLLNAELSIHFMHAYGLIELPQVLETLIPEKAFILIGHSDGGSISLIFAAGKPRLLKGIITEAAHVHVGPETVDGIEKVDKAYRQGKMKGLAKYHGDKTDTIFRAWSQTWLSPWFRHWDIEYLLPSIDSPLLVIQGREDQYGSLAQVEAIVSKTTGPAQPLLIDHCGHSPHLQYPEILLAGMAEFIARHKTD